MTDEISLAGVSPPLDLGVIRARGAEAGTFLQGQLTNDVVGLDDTQARLAGFCSAKGRLQASFIVWRSGPEEFFLACPKSLLAPTLKRLSMFVLRAKCRLSDAGDELVLRGVAADAQAPWVEGLPIWGRRELGAGTMIRLPDAAGLARALFVLPAGGESSLPEGPALTVDAWRWLDLQSGIVTIEAATVDRFVPQMVNFELVGGVDFRKGCFPGQEVVARSQYRGTAKRRTFLFDCDAVPTPGQDVFACGVAGEAVGTVANVAPRPGGPGGSALIELRLAALSGDGLCLGAPDGPRLRQQPLPYAIPLEAAPAD